MRMINFMISQDRLKCFSLFEHKMICKVTKLKVDVTTARFFWILGSHNVVYLNNSGPRNTG